MRIQKSITFLRDEHTHSNWFSPTRATFRFTGLAFICLMGFSSYFCYDNPGALQDYFKSDLDMSTEKYALLYSIFFWPNAIICVVGGFLLDSIFGIRWGTVIYMALAMIGQLIFATGAYLNTFWLMLVGRFVLGVGTESLTIAQKSYATLWFKGKELNMVFGFIMSFLRVGSSVNFLVMESICNYVSNTLDYDGSKRIGVVLFFTSLTCIASMIGALFLTAMDRHAEDVLRRKENQLARIIKLQDVKDFSYIFWLLALIIVFYYVTIFPFLSLAKVYFITKYEFDPAAANTANSLAFTVSIFASPLFGILVDKTRKYILWVIAGIIGTVLCHILFAFTYVSPYVCMVILGLSLSLIASSIWPWIASIVPLQQLGTAYGIAQSLESLALAVVTIACGVIIDKYGYDVLEIFFLACLFISLVIAVIVWISNRTDSESCSNNNK